MFPSQYGTHYVITAGLELHPRIRDSARIERMRIVTPVMKYVDRAHPKSGLDGKFSLQYAAAAAVLDGEVKIDSFTDERRLRPDMAALLDRTTLVHDASIEGDSHHMWVEINTERDDGSRLPAVCRGPKGSWGIPLAPGDHRAKHDDRLGRALPAAAAAELIDGLGPLRKLDR